MFRKHEQLQQRARVAVPSPRRVLETDARVQHRRARRQRESRAARHVSSAAELAAR